MPDLKGYRTLLLNIGAAALVGGLTYMAGVNWTDYLSPTNAMFLMAGVNVLMRVLTTGPVGTKA